MAVVVEDGVVVERQRVELIAPGYPRQVFHACEGLDLDASVELVERQLAHVDEQAARATTAFGSLDGVGIAADERPRSDNVERILASHTLQHMSEGQLIRDALRNAAAAIDVGCLCVPAKELMADGDATWLVAEGKRLGPPWRKDEKLAALAARAIAEAPG
jgi:hypothetical protein